MRRNWKRAAAFGMAALIGCMMPAGTMLAEESEEAVIDTVSENDVPEEAAVDVPREEEAPAVMSAEPDMYAVTALTADAEPDMCAETALTAGAELDMCAETALTADAESETAPEIVITRGGENKACALGGEVIFDYMNNWGSMFEVSVKPNGREVSLFYAQDSVTDMKAAAKTEGQMDSLLWGAIASSSQSIQPLHDGCYVIYVKAIAGTQTFYARSSGIVVDTVKPVIKEASSGEPLVQGQTYSADTRFVVEDAYLDTVMINEQEAKPEADGKYKVATQDKSPSCMIRARDKAGNESTCSINVFGSEPPEIPDESDTTIAESKTYTLQAGVKYHLAAGQWTVEGDRLVYAGDRDFYVSGDGSYTFQKK